MDFELHIVRGRSASETLKLADGVTTVGRQDDCLIRIKSSQVSRKHCELFEKKGLLLVKDLGSANGTIVNGKRVTGQQVLEPGDELTIGGVKLRVGKVGQAPPARETAPAALSPGTPVGVKPAAVADDDFEIDFEDLPTAGEGPEVEAVLPEPDGFEIDLAGPSAPAPSPPQKAPAPQARATAPSAKSKAEAPPKAEPAAEPAEADEAIADFLLDLKLDDD